MDKEDGAYRTISEVAEDLSIPQHVLRFWETRFPQIKPVKRSGGRRYYRPGDVLLLKGIRHLLYGEGYTIKGVQRILAAQGVAVVQRAGARPHDSALTADDDDEVPAPVRELPESAGNGDHDLCDDVDVPDEVEHAVPMMSEPAASTATLMVEPTPRASALPTDHRHMLERTLAELVECKRLLDAVRPNAAHAGDDT